MQAPPKITKTKNRKKRLNSTSSEELPEEPAEIAWRSRLTQFKPNPGAEPDAETFFLLPRPVGSNEAEAAVDVSILMSASQLQRGQMVQLRGFAPSTQIWYNAVVLTSADERHENVVELHFQDETAKYYQLTAEPGTKLTETNKNKTIFEWRLNKEHLATEIGPLKVAELRSQLAQVQLLLFNIQNDEICIQNDGFCIQNDGFCIQNDAWCSSVSRHQAKKMS